MIYRKLYLVLLFLSLIIACGKEKKCEETIDEAYIYPIEAAKGKTLDERIEMFKIPNKNLQCLSTQALLKSCLSYPEMRMIWTEPDLQGGFDKVESMCNGLGSFWQRGDRYKELMLVYKQKDFEHNWKPEPNVEDGRYMDDIVRVELFMSQHEILKVLSKPDKIELFQLVLNNQKKKYSLTQFWGITGMQTTCAILSRIMYLDNYQPVLDEYRTNESMLILISYVLASDLDVINKVMNLSENYILELKK